MSPIESIVVVNDPVLSLDLRRHAPVVLRQSDLVVLRDATDR